MTDKDQAGTENFTGLASETSHTALTKVCIGVYSSAYCLLKGQPQGIDSLVSNHGVQNELLLNL